MKKWAVSYTFPELPAPKMYQTARVEATSMGMACHKAFQEIKSRTVVKGRRLHHAKVTVVEAVDNKTADES